jgi:uncharacterized protein (TIGR00369 family)
MTVNSADLAKPDARPDPNLLLRVPFLTHLGVQIEEMEPGRALLSLDPRPEHYNSWGGVHGGVIMTLLDVCMAVAGRAHDPANLSGVTVDMSVSFILPGKGRQLTEGRVVAQTRTLWRCEAEVRNASDKSLVARAIGTFKFKNLLNKGKNPVGDA